VYTSSLPSYLLSYSSHSYLGSNYFVVAGNFCLIIQRKVDYDTWSPSKKQMRDGKEVFCLKVGVFYHDYEPMGKR
jgi:hypothetical protein